jgi:ABC-type oligopeptide transport system substrate-binding subunit
MRHFTERSGLTKVVCAGLLMLGVGLAAWLPADLPGQGGAKPGTKAGQKKQRTEEEEDSPDVKVKPMVTQPDDEKTPTKAPAMKTSVPQGGDLLAASKQASHFAIKQLFHNLGRPHDLVTFKAFSGVTGDPREREEKVEPLLWYAGSNPNGLPGPLTLKPYDFEWQSQKAHQASPREIKSIVPYEVLAQQAVQNFLNRRLDQYPPDNVRYLSRPEQLAAAERVLSEAVRFHDSARERGERQRPKDWEPVVASLKKQLLEILLEQLDDLAKAKDWDQAFALTRRLATNYKEAEDQVRIARPLTELLKAALRQTEYRDDRMREARQRLRQLEEQFPNSPTVEPLRIALRDQAQALFDQARELAKDKKDLDKAQELAKLAEETWQVPGLRAFRIELSKTHAVLRVAVRDLPRYLSPARACTDAELRGVDLLFESLVKLVPDAVGGSRYHSGLAEGRPVVGPMGRQFRLPRNACWRDGTPVSGADVRFTAKELKEGKGNGRSALWGTLLDKVVVGGDPYRLEVTLTQGYLEPLSLMTFKVLKQGPTGYADKEEFATKPVGSGPFQYEGRRTEQGREYASFVANPYYGSRAGKLGLPRIQEIRFYAYPEQADLAAEFASGQIDLALDLSARQVGLLKQAGLTIVGLPRTLPNLRVYFLAVNHRKPSLNNPDLRRALAHAINREKLLDDHFRGGLKRELHPALNSPYPANAWPCDPQFHNRVDKSSLDPFDPDQARTFQEQAARAGYRNVKLSLSYPSDDPTAAKALTALRDQVKATIGVDLELMPRDPHQLRQDVEEVHYFDLAYYHYDFPDETYWLWPLLGGGGTAGENYIGFKNDDVQNLLQEAMGYRHFLQVQQYTRAVHSALVREMPVIPLWQLDSFAAVSKDVKTEPFDPLRVFADVELWRLDRK